MSPSRLILFIEDLFFPPTLIARLLPSKMRRTLQGTLSPPFHRNSTIRGEKFPRPSFLFLISKAKPPRIQTEAPPTFLRCVIPDGPTPLSFWDASPQFLGSYSRLPVSPGLNPPPFSKTVPLSPFAQDLDRVFLWANPLFLNDLPSP